MLNKLPPFVSCSGCGAVYRAKHCPHCTDVKLEKPDHCTYLKTLAKETGLQGNIDPYVRAIGKYFLVESCHMWPVDLIAGACDAAAFGGLKYKPGDWRQMPHDRGYRLFRAAASRHARAYLEGDFVDVESELNHAFHFACNAIFAEWHREQGLKS